VVVGQGNGVANAKAHAEVLRPDDADPLDLSGIVNRCTVTLHCKVIIDDESHACQADESGGSGQGSGPKPDVSLEDLEHEGNVEDGNE